MGLASTSLINRLRAREASVGVVGLGYVGLPLVVEFAKAGFTAVGFDVDALKIDQVREGHSYIPDVSAEQIQRELQTGHLSVTMDFNRLAEVDTISICVPTPLRKTKDPDLSFIVAAVEEIASHLRRGQLIVLESTSYPGTIEEIVQPRLEAKELRAGRDFYLAFSPERVDPGNLNWHTANIPKVIGGIDETSTAVATVLYEQIVKTIVPVSSTKVAEMVKLLENTFRAVNIGLVNELTLMCHELHVDVWEVIDAAKTKPFGFMPFYPGPGLGGHCLPVDPFYLSWKARQDGFESRFIELAGHTNAAMPKYVLGRIGEALNSVSKAIRGSRVHLFGVSYKANVADIRESPAIDIAQLLHKRGAVVSYSDPYVPKITLTDIELESLDSGDALDRGLDCALITTNHDCFDYNSIVHQAPLIVDTRNALKGFTSTHIFKL